jgi:hypothetical protein
MAAMGRKCAPLSLRLSEGLNGFVMAEARRTKRSRAAVLEALVNEALRTRMMPGIAFRGDDDNRRAWLIGTSLEVWQVIESYEDFDKDFDRVIAETAVTERELRTAIAYYERFAQEIEDLIARDRPPVGELRAEYPDAHVRPVEAD